MSADVAYLRDELGAAGDVLVDEELEAAAKRADSSLASEPDAYARRRRGGRLWIALQDARGLLALVERDDPTVRRRDRPVR